MGDRALLVLTGGADPAALAAHLRANPVPGQEEVVPAAETVLVHVAEGRLDAAARALAHVDAGADQAAGSARTVRLDVVYDGPDLADVAAGLGTSVDAVVTWHSGTTWRSAFVGFAPGFAYLLPDVPLGEVSRRPEPRTAVPPGSVALAGPYGAVYPRSSPGGWQLVGTTSGAVWDVTAPRPALLGPGTKVVFRVARAVATTAGGSRPPVEGGHRGARRAERPEGVRAGASSRDAGTAALPGRSALEVLAPGPSTLVQDLGRPGRQSDGVPRGGAADRAAAVVANRLVGNPRGAAVLEAVLGGLVLRAHGDLVVAVTGAPAPLVVRRPDDDAGTAVGTARPLRLPDGWTLELGAPARGLRSYVAVRGGVDTAHELGSRSTDVLSGLGPRPLATGDVLPVGRDPGDAVPHAPDLPYLPDVLVSGDPGGATGLAPLRTVEVLPGPRHDWLTAAARRALHEVEWAVSDRSNRVGVRLDGPPLSRAVARELPSEGAVPGAIQVPPSGLPIALLADHPVTGGYPVVAVVRAAHVDRLAQLRPGDRLRLVPVPDGAPGVRQPPPSGGVGREEVP
ncbi:5-oxoprolinase/urea amidolyase family protein [Actinotalea sp. AC32]|nr:5-oxoprolinase/urea amidolyase family protein [Actinotalea sp. AC32]